MMYRVKLTKIKSNHTNLRTDTVEGVTAELPTKDKSFNLIGESLTEGMNARLVYTTEVQSVESVDMLYKFTTLNSEYHLQVLEEIP